MYYKHSEEHVISAITNYYPYQHKPAVLTEMGVVPKRDGSWCIIMDLSSPRGSSINDFIEKEDYTLHYTTFDEALTLVSSFGTRALMVKLDLKHTFRRCPVSPNDWDLLGIILCICWANSTWISTYLSASVPHHSYSIV